MQPGTCKLCRRDAELHDSHVGAPSWALRRLLATDPINKKFVLIDGQTSTFSNDNRREPLLCGMCEQRFGRWEKYAGSMSLQLDGTFPARDLAVPADPVDVCEAPDLDCDALARFALSIFWRRSVSTIEENFTLGASVDEQLRQFLVADSAGLHGDVHVFGMLIRPSATFFERAIYHTPIVEVGEERGAIFTMWGLQFILHVGSPPSFAPYDLLRGRRLILTDGNEALEFAVQRIRSATPSGAFGRYRARVDRETPFTYGEILRNILFKDRR